MEPSTKEHAKVDSIDKTSRILSILQERIIGGNLVPGTELQSEKELAAQLGVSRFSLREALRVAEAQGLIRIQQGKRPVVASPSAVPATIMMGLALKRTRENLVDLVTARDGLECKIVRMAAEKITNTELHSLEENLKLMEIPGRDLDYYVAKDMEFHEIILKAARSLVFEIMLSPVTQLLKESRKATLGAGGIKRAMKLHQEIYLALLKHDPDEAEEKMRRHMKNAIEDLALLEKKRGL
ncbi:MAG: FCD domain-containing protein [Treponemataceae bacterium]